MSPSFDQSQPLLIKTKLSAPQRRTDLVSRPHLRRLLEDGSKGKLTLICAPPGYGKTTLLTEWIASLQKAEASKLPILCWLSLDEQDNDPTLFSLYLVRAIEENIPLSGDASAILETFPPIPLQTFLSILINDLNDLDGPICLVLDDYQFITNHIIHEGIAYLLDHLPVPLHIMIATRSDPPFPLARLRARNQLVEIRADDLRFKQDEAAAFLTQVMNLPLSSGDIQALENRTEGWIAGLQMAAVAMRGLARQDNQAVPGIPKQEGLLFSEFIERFSGSHRYILDYMAEETINHLPEEVQHFLSWTSTLDRFCAPLCDAILEDPAISSREMLRYLDRANLFLIALDADTNSNSSAVETGSAGERGGANEIGECWYRYHHLFADLLRARLKQAQPGKTRELHLRASAWYEQNGSIVEAVQYSLLARDHEHSAELIGRYGPARWSQSDPSIMMLASHLPLESLIDHPKIGVYQAWTLMASGQTQAAMSLLHPLQERVCKRDIHPSMTWIAAFIDLLMVYPLSPTDRSVRQTLPDPQALNMMSAEDSGLHNIGDFLYAMLLGRSGDLEEPANILIHMVERDAAAGGTTAIPLAISFLARIRLMQCRLHEAATLCSEYLKSVSRRGAGYFYNAGSLNIILGEALREWNRLDEAEAQIRKGIKINQPWHLIATDSLGYAALARVQEARGDIDGALSTMEELDAMFADRSRPPDWEGELRSLRVRLWLATGDLARAVDWANNFPFHPYPDPLQETDHLTAVRVRLAEKNYPEAQHILEALEQTPGIEKRVNRKIKIHLLLAFALAGQNQAPQALKLLENCLDLAETEGLIRVFLDNGEPMKELLRLYLSTRAPFHRAYAQKLLDEFPNGRQEPSRESTQPVLAEPLTPRELEVLHLMGAGFSNRQIADNLVLSEGTIKFHVHSILGKLEVHSRTAALARAKELGMI